MARAYSAAKYLNPARNDRFRIHYCADENTIFVADARTSSKECYWIATFLEGKNVELDLTSLDRPRSATLGKGRCSSAHYSKPQARLQSYAYVSCNATYHTNRASAI